jgi:hypothetical protein
LPSNVFISKFAFNLCRYVTVRTGPGVTQALCAAAPLASDPGAVSAAVAAAVAGTLTGDAAQVVDAAGLACAVQLASNLIAADVSGCFGPTPPPAASRPNVAAAIDAAAAAVGKYV